MAGEIAKSFPELFGTKDINGRKLSVEETIGTLSGELDEGIARALTERRRLLGSKERVAEKYAFPDWDDAFPDPVKGGSRTFRQIVQGMIDNFLGRETESAWRLNDEAPIPDGVHPLRNPGLELTGPWHPLDMAVKQINADVSATMGPDDEDAAPADSVPSGAKDRAVGLMVSRRNERRLLSGEVLEAVVAKKGQPKRYRIEKQRDRWPTSLHRVPGIHLRTPHVEWDGRQAPAIIVDYVIHALNDYGPLREAGSGLYYYQPKIQSPSEALIVARLVWRLERLMGAKRPGEFIKFKALYEEGGAGRFLPVIMWTWRYWLIGTNVGRWDYTGSIIEMWKGERMLPDPQNGALMGMTSPHMMAYQRYNALLNLMAGVKGGELTNGAPIGGMAAVMLYPKADPYGRHRHNPVTLRAMKMDKLRERLIGLIFVPEEEGQGRVGVTLADVLEGRAKGRLYDTYRQSWVATPDTDYVAAGNGPLRAPLGELQAMLDAPEAWEEADGRPVAPKVSGGLTRDERRLLTGLRLLNEEGRITPWVVARSAMQSPEGFLSKEMWGEKDLWGSLYDIPEGEVTVENVQHAFYMAANYGFQVLNGNLAAAIDDYKAFPNRVVRFMNDLATYRIFVGWLWTVMHLGARSTRDGQLKRPTLTEDGVIPAEGAADLKAGTAFTPELFERLWHLHDEWTRAFFEDFDRLAAMRIVASAILGRHGKDLPSGSEREGLLDTAVRRLVSVVGKRLPPGEAAREVAATVGAASSSSSEVERDVNLIGKIDPVRQALSQAYGGGPSYAAELSYEEAAARVSELTGIDRASALAEIEAAAPRFDRSKAPVIMDVLRRQLLSPLYIQHSPRVLFVIADRGGGERAHILDAVYYVDGRGTPLFRDEGGQPSRTRLAEAVEDGKVPRYALEAHDYVYDVFPELGA